MQPRVETVTARLVVVVANETKVERTRRKLLNSVVIPTTNLFSLST